MSKPKPEAPFKALQKAIKTPKPKEDSSKK